VNSTQTKADGRIASISKAHWSAELLHDLEQNRLNGCVGSFLLSETDRVRVWHLTIPPNGRCSFHRHVLDYFWTAHTSGKARNYFEDGTTTEVEHYEGEIQHLTFGKGEFMVHSVENVGDTELLFTTVEFLDSANSPLAIPNAKLLRSEPQ
jgi:beta-alanine degradation protein BauB